jgi:hypothetical protein
MKDLREVYVDKINGQKRLITAVCYKNMLPVDQKRLIKQTEIKDIPDEFKNKSNKQENGPDVGNGQKPSRKSKALSSDSSTGSEA